MRLAALVTLASWTIGVCAQRPGGHWFLNVTVGGIFDEIPQCSVSSLDNLWLQRISMSDKRHID